MVDYVYLFDSKDKAKVKGVLEADSLAEDSFTRLGYDFKDSAILGLPEGKAVVHFAKEGDAGALIEKLKTVESFSEATKVEKEAVLKALDEQSGNAAQGFGSIFG